MFTIRLCSCCLQHSSMALCRGHLLDRRTVQPRCCSTDNRVRGLCCFADSTLGTVRETQGNYSRKLHLDIRTHAMCATADSYPARMALSEPPGKRARNTSSVR